MHRDRQTDRDRDRQRQTILFMDIDSKVGGIVKPLHDLSRGDIDDSVKFELLNLKTGRLHVEITFFE